MEVRSLPSRDWETAAFFFLMIFQKDGFQVLERYSVVTDYTYISRRDRATNHNYKHFFRKCSRKERLGASIRC